MRSNRGAIPVVVYVVVAGLGLMTVVPSWSPLNWGKPKPPTKELIAAQADLVKAKEEARIANEALEATKRAEEARKASQLVYGSQMTYGASEALKTAPASPQTALAQSLLSRSNTALTAALGSLPQDKQNEIMLIVSQSLSGAADQLAQANATLAIRDKELAAATSERESLKAQLPALQQAVEAKSQEVATQTLKVNQKTQEVVTYAEKLASEKQQSGSLGALVGNLWRTIEIMGVIALIGYGLFLYVRWKFGGIPAALGSGLAEFRQKHPDAAQVLTGILDSNLNRQEQAVIAKHA